MFWVWLLVNYLIRTENANSVISNSPSFRVTSNNLNKQLYKGDIFSLEFNSKFPNLGIVSLRFKTYFRINSDKLYFRIREKGSSVWYYQNIYNTDQFQPDKLFTFGFPKIANSQGKTYEVEIQSSVGTVGNAISVNSEKPLLVIKHHYSLNYLLKDKFVFLHFIYNKSLSLIYDNEFVLYAFLYFLIAVSTFIYGLYLYKSVYLMLNTSIFGIILADIFLIKNIYDSIFIAIFIIWIIFAEKVKMTLKSLSGMVMALLIIAIILQFTDTNTWFPKASGWIYITFSTFCLLKLIQKNNGKQ